MAEDLIETFSVFSHALVSFSIGEYSKNGICNVWGGSMLIEGATPRGKKPQVAQMRPMLVKNTTANPEFRCAYIKTVLKRLVLHFPSPNIP